MEDESAPLLKGRITPLIGVNASNWQSSDAAHGYHATVNKPSPTIDVRASNNVSFVS